MVRPDFREIYHYGVQEKSGRYKWGSGDRPYQRLEGSKRYVRKVDKTIKKLNKNQQKIADNEAAKKYVKEQYNRARMDRDFHRAESMLRTYKLLDEKIDKYMSKDKKLFEVLEKAGVSVTAEILPTIDDYGRLTGDFLIRYKDPHPRK